MSAEVIAYVRGDVEEFTKYCKKYGQEFPAGTTKREESGYYYMGWADCSNFLHRLFKEMPTSHDERGFDVFFGAEGDVEQLDQVVAFVGDEWVQADGVTSNFPLLDMFARMGEEGLYIPDEASQTLRLLKQFLGEENTG